MLRTEEIQNEHSEDLEPRISRMARMKCLLIRAHPPRRRRTGQMAAGAFGRAIRGSHKGSRRSRGVRNDWRGKQPSTDNACIRREVDDGEAITTFRHMQGEAPRRSFPPAEDKAP